MIAISFVYQRILHEALSIKRQIHANVPESLEHNNDPNQSQTETDRDQKLRHYSGHFIFGLVAARSSVYISELSAPSVPGTKTYSDCVVRHGNLTGAHTGAEPDHLCDQTEMVQTIAALRNRVYYIQRVWTIHVWYLTCYELYSIARDPITLTLMCYIHV